MLHDLLWTVLGKSNAQLGKHAHMCTLQAKTSVEQRNEFVKVSIPFILADNIRKLFSVNDEVQTTDLSQTELFLGNTGLVHLLPDLGAVRLSCAFNCSLVVLQVNKSRCELSPIGDARVKDFCRFMVTFLISLV